MRELIPLTLLIRRPELQVRAHVSERALAEYTAAYREGGPAALDPLSALKDTSGAIWIWDGYTRLSAAEGAGLDEIWVEHEPGGFPEAFALALERANTRHGEKLSAEDRERKIGLALKDPRYAGLSNEVLGQKLGVSRETVRQVRHRLEAAGQVATVATVTGKDGRSQAARKKKAAEKPKPATDDPETTAAPKELLDLLERLDQHAILTLPEESSNLSLDRRTKDVRGWLISARQGFLTAREHNALQRLAEGQQEREEEARRRESPRGRLLLRLEGYHTEGVEVFGGRDGGERYVIDKVIQQIHRASDDVFERWSEAVDQLEAYERAQREMIERRIREIQPIPLALGGGHSVASDPELAWSTRYGQLGALREALKVAEDCRRLTSAAPAEDDTQAPEPVITAEGASEALLSPAALAALDEAIKPELAPVRTEAALLGSLARSLPHPLTCWRSPHGGVVIEEGERDLQLIVRVEPVSAPGWTDARLEMLLAGVELDVGELLVRLSRRELLAADPPIETNPEQLAATEDTAREVGLHEEIGCGTFPALVDRAEIRTRLHRLRAEHTGQERWVEEGIAGLDALSETEALQLLGRLDQQAAEERARREALADRLEALQGEDGRDLCVVGLNMVLGPCRRDTAFTIRLRSLGQLESAIAEREDERRRAQAAPESEEEAEGEEEAAPVAVVLDMRDPRHDPRPHDVVELGKATLVVIEGPKGGLGSFQVLTVSTGEKTRWDLTAARLVWNKAKVLQVAVQQDDGSWAPPEGGRDWTLSETATGLQEDVQTFLARFKPWSGTADELASHLKTLSRKELERVRAAFDVKSGGRLPERLTAAILRAAPESA